MRDPPFVDAHMHLWDLDRIHYPWLTPPFADDGPNGSVASIAKSYLLDDYLADARRWDIRGIIHVEAGAAPTQAVDETKWLERIADERGLPNAIIAFAALDDPALEPLLERHAAHPRVRGIRHIVNWHRDPKRSYAPRDVTGDPAWQRGFGLLERHALSFDLQAYPGQFVTLAPLIDRHPGIPVIINHNGMASDLDEAGQTEWRHGMEALAELPNVSVKVSGMGFVHRQWSADLVRDYVLRTIDLFGRDRVMFASDFPTDKLFGGFDATLNAYAAIVASFSIEERRAMFAGNANRVYRLGLSL